MFIKCLCLLFMRHATGNLYYIEICYFLEHGSIGLEKLLHYMTSLDRIPPLGLDKNVEVEFLQDENPNFFADTYSLFLRVPTMHKTIKQFKEKLFDACDNYLGHGAL